ncbi:MAG: UDP-N-acetylglucosamine pyrophosphorylase [Lachnospiraceae bacterium]|nr:UDP-N-acetylglucosamine pyrophosphorylase [Lachnospiraceae bacterium]
MEAVMQDLLNLEETIAAEIFRELHYPWEALPRIRDFIAALGPALDPAVYEQKGEHVWIAKSAEVAPTAFIGDYVIIDEGAKIRHCAFLRECAIVGKGATVGNSTELKNVLLFNQVEAPHYNYVGDSILGFHAHMGAGSITSNVKADRKNIVVKNDAAAFGMPERIVTGLRKFGAILGDYAEIGCNAVLNPGTVVGSHSNVYPTVSVRGVVPAGHIVKDARTIVPKE